jgi:hypothetical protein
VSNNRAGDKAFKPGQARPEGSGRQKGTPNKNTAELKALAMTYSEEAILKIYALMQSKDEDIALRASQEMLNRAVGKPKQQVDLFAKFDPATATVEELEQIAARLESIIPAAAFAALETDEGGDKPPTTH